MDDKRIVTQAELDEADILHNKYIEDEDGGKQAVFENCTFERLSFAGKQFNSAVFRNCEFKLCDLTGAGMCFAEMKDVSFSSCDCHMLAAEETALRDVSFDRCDLRIAVFTHSSLRNIAFNKCETEGMSMQNCYDLPEAEIIRISTEELRKMSDKEGLILQGCGGDLHAESLEELFMFCNTCQDPPGYCGHSMSVSDVIEICEGKDKGFYYVDSIGFKKLPEFDISKTDHSDMMKIVVLENDHEPYTAEIRKDIHAMQSVVGGNIEPVYFEESGDAVCWCNDEFLLNGSAPNRVIGNTLIHGTCFISGDGYNEEGERDSCSLTDEQIDIVPALDRMIVLDYIIANEDRHFNNFGLLRNADTLEWLGAAPIFDSGTSLWYNRLTSRLLSRDVGCKPFKKTHGEQLKLVSSFGWFDVSKLDGIEDEIMDVLCDEKAAQYIDAERAKAIAAEVRNRINTVEIMAMNHTQDYDISSTEGDIEEDTAESYGMKIE